VRHAPFCCAPYSVFLCGFRRFLHTWKQLSLAEKKAILKVMFVALYFDQDGKVKKVLANTPFDAIAC